FAVIKQPNLTFGGLTIDEDLPNAFSLDELFVVTDELGFAESSPDGIFKIIDPTLPLITKNGVITFASKYGMHKAHKWFFKHRIIVEGACTDQSDVPICDEIVRALG